MDEELHRQVRHDVQSSLAAITGFAELLQLRDDDETRTVGSASILVAAERLSVQLDDVLALLELETSSSGLSPEPVELGEVVDELEVRQNGHVLPVVDFDRRWLGELLGRVSRHARAVAGEAPASLSMRTTKETALLTLSWERADGADAASGFTLEVARRIAEAGGGWLDAADTEVTVALPLPRDDSEPVSHVKVALVDDDEDMRRLLRLTLAGSSYEIREARSAAAAQELFAKPGAADIVLLDWNLPDGSGGDVLANLRSRFPDLPVVVLTADHARGANAGDLGADAFLTKPFSPLQLLATLERLLEART